MAIWDDWLKKRLQGDIKELLKADGVTSAPDVGVVANGDSVPNLPEEGHDPATQIGRKAIVDDPYFDNLSQQIVYKHKLTRLSNRTLKDVSLRDWLVSSIIQARVDTLLRFSRPEHKRFEMGFRVIKKDDKAPYTDEDRAEISALEDFIYHCGRKENTPHDDKMLFGEFMKLVARDAITFGNVAIEKVKTRVGGLHRFRPLPAESVYLINRRLSKEQIEQEVKAQRSMYQPGDNDPKVEQVVNETQLDYYKYVQVSYDNRPLANFGDEDLVFKLFNPQNFADSNGYCYPAKTALIQLANGKVKYIEDLEINDEVITHLGVIKPVLQKKTRHYSGNLINVRANGLTPFSVTPEHPILAVKEGATAKDFVRFRKSITPEWQSAGSLEKGDYLCVPRVALPTNVASVDISHLGNIKDDFVTRATNSTAKLPRMFPLSDEFAWFLGLYLGDGCVLNNKSVVIDIALDEITYFGRIRNLFQPYGISVKCVKQKANSYRVFIHSKLLTELIVFLCPGKVKTKSLNTLLFKLPESAKLSLLLGFIDADGNIAANGSIKAATVSDDLAYGLSLLANSLGALVKVNRKVISTNYAKKCSINYLSFCSYDLQQLGVTAVKGVSLTATKRTAYLKDDKYFYVKLGSITSKPFEGQVYNCEIKDDHSYIANQVASHNCYSPLELAIINITNHLNVENYNSNFFTHGYAARGILHLKGTVTQGQLMNFRRQFYNTITGQQHAWRTPIVAGLDEVQWVPMSANAKEMEYINFNNHLMRIICAQFQIDPVELGLDYLVSATGRSPTQQANNEYKINYSRERGLVPILMFIEDLMNSDLLPALDKELAHKYKFVFQGYTDETPQTEIAQMQAEMTVYKSMNDLLAQAQKDKIDSPAAALPLNQAFWALVEKNYTRGEIREIFFGDKGASQRKELQYIPADQSFMTWQQTLLAISQAKEQKEQMAQQQSAEMQAQQQEAQAEMQQQQLDNKHAEAKHGREKEKHDMEIEQMKAQAAMNAVKHGNPLQDAAKQFGASKADNIGGKVIANPINKINE